MSNNIGLSLNEIDSHLEPFYRLFKGRTDRVGLATTLSTAVYSEEEILQHLQHHLFGKTRLGFYNLLPNATVPWAVVEFEDHGPFAMKDPATTSLELVDVFARAGIHAHRELSKNGSGKCYHVWIFFDTPISAMKVRVALEALVSSALGIRTEIFPKGYEPGSLGNFVWLPLFGGADDHGKGMPDQPQCL